MQDLQRAEGAEEGQGHKALGIHRPCLSARNRDFSSFTIGQQGFELPPRAPRDSKKEAHNESVKSFAEGQVDLPTQIHRVYIYMYI